MGTRPGQATQLTPEIAFAPGVSFLSQVPAVKPKNCFQWVVLRRDSGFGRLAAGEEWQELAGILFLFSPLL